MPTGVYRRTEEHNNKISLGLKGHKTSKETREKIGLANRVSLKGKHPKSEFKKGTVPWNKGLRGVQSDEKHPMWKGERVGYFPLHMWIFRKFGHPEKCEDCGKLGEKFNKRWNIDWSNSDHKYRRERNDWSGRCKSCHKLYDIKNNLK